VFVANFVGTLNNASAEVATLESIAIDGVQLESAVDLKDRKKGDKVRVAIRPERFACPSRRKPM
jgi:ABC-type Fe3+/spermidine/putrescine transport system ATPase subunit